MNKNTPVKPYFKRVFLVLSVMTALLIALTFRLSNIQLTESEKYRTGAFDQYTTEIDISPRRGTIYDRNMTALAVSATVETVYISPYEIPSEQEAIIADYLSVTLGVNRSEIVQRMGRKQSKYQIIKKKVDRTITDEIRKFIEENHIEGIHLEEDTKRLYPYGNLASNVIGFTNSENMGIYGIESFYEQYLKGSSGKIITAQNAKGKDMPFEYESYVGAKNGLNVVLTIDWQVQSFLEKHLQTALEDTQARNRVLGIIMDVNTGDILAMSTKPDYDLNNPYDLDEEMQLLYDEFCNTPLEAENGNKVLPTEEQKKSLKAYVGKEVFFGIRPEDLEYTKTPGPNNNMQMKVSVVEPLGAETHLYLNTKTQTVIARTDPEFTFRVGDTANFAPVMEKAKFFDKETEQNICEVVNAN